MNLEDLYGKIPKMTCIPGCSDCCGIVPWSKTEWRRMVDRRVQKSIHCPYIGKDGRCDCYDLRPLMCRLFGTAEDLRCPHGAGPSVLLKPEEANAILREYMEDFQ